MAISSTAPAPSPKFQYHWVVTPPPDRSVKSTRSGEFTNVTLRTEPGALMEPFLAASWSSNSTPNWQWALQNRSETLSDYAETFLDIASSDTGRRAPS